MVRVQMVAGDVGMADTLRVQHEMMAIVRDDHPAAGQCEGDVVLVRLRDVPRCSGLGGRVSAEQSEGHGTLRCEPFILELGEGSHEHQTLLGEPDHLVVAVAVSEWLETIAAREA
jgi:hypothetical protein